ncbi:hypothetical protein D0N73_21685, partial [Pseudomonas fluorescens]
MANRLIHRNGQVVWVRLTVGMVRDEQGQPSCFVSQTGRHHR